MVAAHREDLRLDDLVAQARAGSGPAFTKLWEQLAPVVAGYVRSRGVQEVDDATSEVFLGAFRRLDEFDGDGAAFRRWLFTIAHHRAIDAVRHQSRRAHDVPYEGESDLRAVRSAESEALRRIDSAAALALVAELPADQRAVLLLRTVADLPVAEVAQELDRSADAVRQLHRRALARLRARTVIQTVG